MAILYWQRDMEMASLMKIIFSLVLVGMVSFLLCMWILWQESQRVRRKLQAQGVHGPPPSFLYGNLSDMQNLQKQAELLKDSNHFEHHSADYHDYTTVLFPYFEYWRKQYGLVYTYSTGMKQHLYINQPELVKEMNQSITLDLGKPSYVTKKLAPLLGNGIARSNGLTWAQQRKIVAPEFFMDKVKGMMGQITESALSLLRKWEDCIEDQGGVRAEIEVIDYLKGCSADVISRLCFGSSSIKVKELVSKLRHLTMAISNQGFLFNLTSISGKNFPTKSQKEIDSLENEIESMIWESVKERQRDCANISSSDKDLMQLILEAAIMDKSVRKESYKNFVVDNCKTIYFAGHESTAVAASWCLMFLASHPEWQDRIRMELSQHCANGLPDANSLPNLKAVSMVIQEVLRLYPPGAFVSREALEDIQIGNLKVPKGVCIWTLIPTLHRDSDIWGIDANEFKPERFKDGVCKACKIPQAYIPFGLGPRLCLGKNLAMVELKILLSLIVSKFSISLSPKYRHSPVFRMIVEPENGVRIIIQKA